MNTILLILLFLISIILASVTTYFISDYFFKKNNSCPPPPECKTGCPEYSMNTIKEGMAPIPFSQYVDYLFWYCIYKTLIKDIVGNGEVAPKYQNYFKRTSGETPSTNKVLLNPDNLTLDQVLKLYDINKLYVANGQYFYRMFENEPPVPTFIAAMGDGVGKCEAIHYVCTYKDTQGGGYYNNGSFGLTMVWFWILDNEGKNYDEIMDAVPAQFKATTYYALSKPCGVNGITGLPDIDFSVDDSECDTTYYMDSSTDVCVDRFSTSECSGRCSTSKSLNWGKIAKAQDNTNYFSDGFPVECSIKENYKNNLSRR